MIDPKNLVSFEGFLEAFWSEFRRTGKTQREVYDSLEGLYWQAFGVTRFPSYGAFRKQRDRKTRR